MVFLDIVIQIEQCHHEAVVIICIHDCFRKLVVQEVILVHAIKAPFRIHDVGALLMEGQVLRIAATAGASAHADGVHRSARSRKYSHMGVI